MKRGFSLIEVMIGVVVLALGLLGLGAVIPVVIREQRISSDTTLGRSCLNDVRALLLQNPQFNPDTLPTVLSTGAPALPGRTMWDLLLTNKTWSGPYNATGGTNQGLWQGWRPGSTSTGTLDPDLGDMYWDDNAYPQPAKKWQLHLTDRLWPNESSQVREQLPNGVDPYRPVFVWDIAARRAEFGDLYARSIGDTAPEYPLFIGKQDVVQVAVFVRRIDLNIRLPRSSPGVTLRDVLLSASRVSESLPTNVYNAAEQRLPVTVDTNGLPTNTGDPTLGGYSQLIFVDAHLDATHRNRIIMDSGSVTEQRQARRQPGQKVVDNLGNVYTVLAQDADDPSYVPPDNELIVDPPVPYTVADFATGSASTIRQLVFTPQIPVAVEVLTLKRPVAAN